MRNAKYSLIRRVASYKDLEQRSWTIDIMPIEDSAPNEAECITIREGLIKCMRTINEECMRQYGKELSEEDIQEIMRTGKHERLPQKYLTIVEECLRAYVDKVYNIHFGAWLQP